MTSVSRLLHILAPCAALASAPLLFSAAAKAAACAEDNAELTLPATFCATVFANNVGRARHLAMAPDGTLYVNTRRGRNDTEPPAGGYLVALRDQDGNGKAESVERFGEPTGGGTGIAIHQGYLYVESNGRILRYTLTEGMAPQSQPEVVLYGLVTEGGHTSHAFAIGTDNALYVNSGSATNACQVEDRKAGSPGEDPCKELETRAGIWKYHALRTGQHFSPAERFVTGVRNVVGLDVHPSGALVLSVHGRDQLYENWPERFTLEQGSDLPAEVLVHAKVGENYGWPYCYYDGQQDKYVLAPEYGGDGKRTTRCENLPKPIAVHPAHWAPNGLVFYRGTLFPEKYRGGAFIAYHGSWNRAEQQGYNIIFQPFDSGGSPNGPYEVFADGFAGATKTPQGAAHRPSGVTVGTDGALYVSDDQGGRIYRIVPR